LVLAWTPWAMAGNPLATAFGDLIRFGCSRRFTGAVHTNTIEGFWSIFKCGVVGFYHKVRPEISPALRCGVSVSLP